MTQAAILGEGISKRYRGGVWALRDVGVQIAAGEITALVGPNGAGKTTLLRTLLGFEKLTGGKLQVLGLDPWRRRRQALLQIGYVPQATALYRSLSVQEHLELARFLRPGFDVAGARNRLNEVGVALNVEARRLSGGQQAQLSLAIALGTHASVLLLDEPLASLDPLARRDFIQALLRAARSDGSTVLLTSHIVTDVEEACTHLAIIGAGVLRLHDSIEAARSGHLLLQEGRVLDGGEPIGSFAGRDGRIRTLWRRPRAQERAKGSGETPDLEDVVLGYLAAGRQADPAGEAAA